MTFATNMEQFAPQRSHAWAMHTMAGDAIPDKPGKLYDPHLFDDLIAAIDHLLAAKMYQTGRTYAVEPIQ